MQATIEPRQRARPLTKQEAGELGADLLSRRVKLRLSRSEAVLISEATATEEPLTGEQVLNIEKGLHRTRRHYERYQQVLTMTELHRQALAQNPPPLRWVS
jgi:hypothetical protein